METKVWRLLRKAKGCLQEEGTRSLFPLGCPQLLGCAGHSNRRLGLQRGTREGARGWGSRDGERGEAGMGGRDGERGKQGWGQGESWDGGSSGKSRDWGEAGPATGGEELVHFCLPKEMGCAERAESSGARDWSLRGPRPSRRHPRLL